MLVLFLCAGSRLVWLQALRGPVWRVQAEGNRRQRVTVRAPRGMIVDRHGTVIAGNKMLYLEPYVDETNRLREKVIPPEQAVQLQATQPAQLKKMYTREYPYGPVLAHILGYTAGVKTSTDVLRGETGIEKYANRELTGVDGAVWYERSAQGRAHRVLAETEPHSGKTLELTLDAELSKRAFAALGKQSGSIIVSTPRGEILAIESPGSEEQDLTQW
jgi:penicillin-binding protein 2